MIERFNRFLAWLARNIKKTIGFLGLIALMALVFTTAFSQGYHFMREDSYAAQDENAGTVAVEIPEDATTNEIADLLQQRGLIEDTWEFLIKARLMGATDDFKSGIYYILEGSSVETIIETLRAGDQSDVVPIHIAAGATIDEIATLLEESGICSATDFQRAANLTTYDISLIKNIEVPEGRRYILEGYVLPGTYQIIRDSSATNVMEVFLERFVSEYTASLSQMADQSGYTLDQILTLASIVQSECAVSSDYSTFASMLLNRIRSGKESLSYWSMPSTVLYAQHRTEEELTSVSEADQQYDSPYNTYLYQGFPPGPICNPSIDAIRAVLYPEDTEYLYYEIDLNAPNGSRHFSVTEEEHNAYLESQR